MHKETIIIRIEEWESGFAAVRYIDHVPYTITKGWPHATKLLSYLVYDCKIDPSRIKMEE